MAKRKPNVSPHSVTSEFEYDSGSDEILVSAKRRKSSESFVSSTVGSKTRRGTIELTEENEHTYSCSPIIFSSSRKRHANDNNVKTTKDQGTRWKSILRSSSSLENNPSIDYLSSATDDDDDDNNDITTDSQGMKSRRSKAKCFSKNAINARINRMKKKQYVSSLENDIKSLKSLRRALSEELSSKTNEIDSLKNEVKYLRSIIANNGQIGGLLKRLCTNDSIEIRSSVLRENSLPELTSDKICVRDTFDNENSVPILNDNIDIPTGIDNISDSNAFIDSNLDVLLGSAAPALNLTDMDEFLRCETPSKYLESCGDIQSDYGVCLHVGKNRISLEFCAACNESASNNWNSDAFD